MFSASVDMLSCSTVANGPADGVAKSEITSVACELGFKITQTHRLPTCSAEKLERNLEPATCYRCLKNGSMISMSIDVYEIVVDPYITYIYIYTYIDVFEISWYMISQNLLLKSVKFDPWVPGRLSRLDCNKWVSFGVLWMLHISGSGV